MLPELNRREPDHTHLKAVAPVRDIGQRASIAQILLLARLRARNRRDLAVDSLERAAHVIFVTCKHWFSADLDPIQPPTPPRDSPSPATEAPPRIEESVDAHRHH